MQYLLVTRKLLWPSILFSMEFYLKNKAGRQETLFIRKIVMCREQLCKLHGPVVQGVDNAIHRINDYPVDSIVCFVSAYPLDSDLSGWQRPTYSVLLLINFILYKYTHPFFSFHFSFIFILVHFIFLSLNLLLLFFFVFRDVPKCSGVFHVPVFYNWNFVCKHSSYLFVWNMIVY